MSDSEIVIAGLIARHYSSPTNNPMGYIQSIHNLMIRSIIFLLIGSRGILVAVLFLLGIIVRPNSLESSLQTPVESCLWGDRPWFSCVIDGHHASQNIGDF